MYLLDTNICIHFLRDKFKIAEKIKIIGFRNCLISEITVFELYFGAEKSEDPKKSFRNVDGFVEGLEVIPIIGSAKRYAKEKLRLHKLGKPVNDEFDMLIASTALHYDLTLVTENLKDFQNFEHLKIENWIQR
ncbi:type II toxin-antitoxin system VapC family toxin [Chryseobacterium koreense]|uniref:type II toxin-antitoxin system VapC family toxin n=1 Tax=Chryseobacterium koreense TaxID=232216 RepID=UPI0026EEE2D7|nr:type II toxin-antitoxin system VapC family toxin [Chryseobacterium koreense]